jgi:microcystin degradation protein MlrC
MIAKRLFLAGVMQETNGFSPIPLGPDGFAAMSWDPAISVAPPADLDMLGYGAVLGGADQFGFTVIPSLFAAATPAAPMRQVDWDAMRDRIVGDLKAALPVDAVFLFLHGAMAAQGEPDCEGDLIDAIRALIGPNVPIAAEYDLHGNVSQRMVALADFTIACRLYPHTDHPERCLRALGLLSQQLLGTIAPTTCAIKVAVTGLFPTDHGAMKACVEKLIEAEAKSGVLSASIFHGFALADYPDTGACVVVTTHDDLTLANEMATHLALVFSEAALATPTKALSIKDALDQAAFCDHGPVVIADRADNAGGGAAGDATFLLREIVDRGIRDVALALFWDPVAVQLGASAGVGARLNLRIGGKVGPMSGDPVDLDVEVLSIKDDIRQAWFGIGEPKLPIGRSIAVKSQGITIVLCTIRQQVFSRHVFEAHGIDLNQQRIIVVKSTQHFYQDFAKLATKVIYCDGPGTVTSAFETLPYRHIVRPLWPIDPAHIGPSRLLFLGSVRKGETPC